MANIAIGKNKTISDYELLNAIRSDGGASYQKDIPLANEDNVTAVGRAIAGNTLAFNHFYNMISKIGLTNYFAASWSDPLDKIFNKGMLEYGTTIESTFIDRVAEHIFSYDDADQALQIAKPNMISYYSTLNRQSKYKTTYSRNEAKKVLRAGGGIDSIVNGIITRLETSSEIDSTEYLLLLIRNAINDGAMVIKEIPWTSDTDTESLTNLVTAARANFEMMQWPKPLTPLNTLGVVNPTKKEDIITLFPINVKSNLDTKLLSGAFQADKVEFLGARQPIPSFGAGLSDNILGVTVDKNFFEVRDIVHESESMPNPETMTVNTWLHVWKLYAYLKFNNAIVYVKKTADSKPYEAFAHFYMSQVSDNMISGSKDHTIDLAPLYGEQLSSLLTAGASLKATLALNIDNTTTAIGPTAALTYDGTAISDYVGNGKSVTATIFTSESADGKTPASIADFNLAKIGLDIKAATSNGRGAYTGTITLTIAVDSADGTEVIADKDAAGNGNVTITIVQGATDLDGNF